MTIFYEKIYGWGILTLFLLKGKSIKVLCNHLTIQPGASPGLRSTDGVGLSNR